MSSPSSLEKEAECLNYSFLSVEAERALSEMLAGKRPSASERQVLLKASCFFKDISNGALLVSTGSYQHQFDPLRSMEALNYAMGPLEHLKEVVADKDVAQFLGDVAVSLEQSEQGIPAAQEHRDNLTFAAQFFRALYDALSQQWELKTEIGRPSNSGWKLAAA